MNTVYKILAEVKLLHEYYLTGTKGETIFAETNPQQRINYLLQQFQQGNATINRDVEFAIPDIFVQRFKDHHLKIIPSYSGFKIAVKCRAQQLADGTIVYQPLVSIPDNLDLMVLLQLKNDVNSYSNVSLKKPLSSLLFFSNDDILSVKQPPFLSAPVPSKDNNRLYEQGDIALFPSGKVNMFLRNGLNPPSMELPGSAYVNEADRVLVPFVFYYVFAAADHITDATFSLKDANGNEIKKISIGGTKSLQNVPLNFRLQNNPVNSFPANAPSDQSIYTLDVTASNGYTKSHRLLFAGDDINLTGAAGIITLKPRVANPQMSLTEGNGILVTKILPGGIKVPAPIFEIWMKSRLVYWRYSNNKQQKIKTSVATQDVLSTVDDDGDGNPDGILITKNPFPLTVTPQLIKKTDGSFQHLPNPVPGAMLTTNGTKNFVTIMVPESAMFPLV